MHLCSPLRNFAAGVPCAGAAKRHQAHQRAPQGCQGRELGQGLGNRHLPDIAAHTLQPDPIPASSPPLTCTLPGPLTFALWRPASHPCPTSPTLTSHPLQANVSRTYNDMGPELLDACPAKPTAWRKLLFSLSFFHAVVQVRPPSIPGWCGAGAFMVCKVLSGLGLQPTAPTDPAHPCS